MIVAKHTAEMCPGGVVRPDKELWTKTEESMNLPGIKLVEGYIDAPRHIFYFVLETDDNTTLNNAIEPLRRIGEVTITPVQKWSDNRNWARKIGIQK